MHSEIDFFLLQGGDLDFAHLFTICAYFLVSSETSSIPEPRNTDSFAMASVFQREPQPKTSLGATDFHATTTTIHHSECNRQRPSTSKEPHWSQPVKVKAWVSNKTSYYHMGNPAFGTLGCLAESKHAIEQFHTKQPRSMHALLSTHFGKVQVSEWDIISTNFISLH